MSNYATFGERVGLLFQVLGISEIDHKHSGRMTLKTERSFLMSSSWSKQIAQQTCCSNLTLHQSQIPQFNVLWEECAHTRNEMVRCGIVVWCIVGFFLSAHSLIDKWLMWLAIPWLLQSQSSPATVMAPMNYFKFQRKFHSNPTWYNHRFYAWYNKNHYKLITTCWEYVHTHVW